MPDSFDGTRVIASWPRNALFFPILMATCLGMVKPEAAAGRAFSFERDTFAFGNETLLEYHEGKPTSHMAGRTGDAPRFTQHCFVMSRAVIQFRKFARFEPGETPLDDRELASRIRKITRQAPWTAPWPKEERIVIPGYADLRSLSRARTSVVQENIGLGWTTYFRPGNWRILWPHGQAQQTRTYRELERTLADSKFFVAYLTTFPKSLSINHGVLVYAREGGRSEGNKSTALRYLAYDPNHPESPRVLEWSERERSFLYQRDWDFVGGPVVVWRVYGKPFQ